MSLTKPVARAAVGATEKIGEQPHNLAIVFLPCPGSFSGHCHFAQLAWTCATCHCTLKHASDAVFYCQCGRAPAVSFEFRCPDSARHGDSFERFSAQDMDHWLTRVRSFREMNILILGETGIEKSTYINAFRNYMTYEAFESAERDPGVVYAIPCVHTITSGGVVGSTTHYVFIGSDEEKAKLQDETKVGMSVTYQTQSYVFKYRDLAIRLIDTPGIGDTAGVEADNGNLQHIIEYVSNFEQLHGICVMLKPNETRLTNRFSYCLKELLRQMHRDAVPNIAFVVTRTRPNEFQPGEVFTILRELVKQIDIPVNLDERTIYCVDDEAVLYLYGLKNGVKYTSRARSDRKESWDWTVAENCRMIEHFMSTEPHKLRQTMSLNDTRRLIRILLDGPLVDVTSLTFSNILQLEHQQRKLDEFVTRGTGENGCGRKLSAVVEEQDAERQLLRDEPIALYSYVHMPLKRPRMVCRAAACTTRNRSLVQRMSSVDVHGAGAPTGGGSTVVAARQVCCESCRAPRLRLCDSIRLLKGDCRKCGCGVAFHAWELYAIEKLATFVPPPPPPPQQSSLPSTGRHTSLSSHAAAAAPPSPSTIEGKLELLKRTVAEQRSEQSVMLDIAAKLAYFQQHNSIVAYNDVFDEYLKMQLAGAEVDFNLCKHKLRFKYFGLPESVQTDVAFYHR